MWAFLKKSIKAIAYFVWRLGPRLMSLAFVVGLIFLIMFAVLDTRRDVAYRYSAPDSVECATRLAPANSTILASDKINNDERRAIERIKSDDPDRHNAFTCMLQLHAMKPGFVPENPDIKAGNPSIGYYLSFLEFEETGNPAQRGRNGKLLDQLQFNALADHLNRQKKAGRQNFVFAFVHGWRHDARIGDENVRNVRLIAAHLASFLEQRCQMADRYCGVTVTAVYVGWRGARVDEQRLGWLFHGYLSGFTSTVGNVLASMTLFDRKPVSERIAPSVVSALHEIDRRMHDANEPSDWFERPRMIVVGHSLGGNLLATALQDSMIGIVNKNLDAIQKAVEAPNTIQPQPLVKSPLGDLVVLLNPAAEAEKWTSIQRAFSRRMNAPVDSTELQRAYRVNQPPIYLSLTAAHSWPANGIHLSDVRGFQKEDPGKPGCAAIRARDGDGYKPSYDYDSATYDLFPFFKGDFRPFAQTMEDWSDPNPFECKGDPGDENMAQRPNVVAGALWKGISAALRNHPFMNTDIERTRTIGHVDPMRAPFGRLVGRENDPATWIGTTHELLINSQRKQKAPEENVDQGETAVYADAGSPLKSECDIVDHWLTTARAKPYANVQRGGGALVNWDSAYSHFDKSKGKIVPGRPDQPNLTRIRFRPDDPAIFIEGQIRQTLFFSGMRSITGANDPFWNIRAFESAMTSHNGYVSYPLICSIFQFVMDKITDDAFPAAPSKS